MKLVLFFDWDETISSHDTLSLIAPPEGTHPGPPFSSYTSAYLADLEQHEQKYAHLKKEKKKKNNIIESQYEFLQSLDDVELASQKRIEEGGLFLDFDPVAMEKRAREKVRLRPGWEQLCRQSSIENIEKHIISVGWSARFIAAALQQGNGKQMISICANEVELDPITGRGTGRLTKSSDTGESTGRFGIRIAQHKLREMRRIIRGRHVRTCYAGDSNTDLPCLLEADVGLIFGESKSLRETITRLGMSVQSAAEWGKMQTTRETDMEKVPILVHIQDWSEGADVLGRICQESALGQ